MYIYDVKVSRMHRRMCWWDYTQLLNRSFVYKAKEGRHVRIMNIFCYQMNINHLHNTVNSFLFVEYNFCCSIIPQNVVHNDMCKLQEKSFGRNKTTNSDVNHISVSTNPQILMSTTSQFLPIHKFWCQPHLSFYQSTNSDVNHIPVSVNPQILMSTTFQFLPIHKFWCQPHLGFYRSTNSDVNLLPMYKNEHQQNYNETTVLICCKCLMVVFDWWRYNTITSFDST
jgi:uncharacterized protein YeaC (DUF1315 family)